MEPYIYKLYRSLDIKVPSRSKLEARFFVIYIGIAKPDIRVNIRGTINFRIFRNVAR